MLEFKNEADAEGKRRAARIRFLSWSAVLSLLGLTILLFVLGIHGALRAHPDLGSLFVVASLSALVGTGVLVIREAWLRAEREIVFALDDYGIVRKRKGWPDVKIAFSEVHTLREEFGWLVVATKPPGRRIAVRKNINGFEAIRAELTRHYALSPPAEFPPMTAGPLAISILSWAAVIWFHDPRVVIPAGVIALAVLGLASHRLWILLRRASSRSLPWVCLGIVWFAAILLIYIRAARP